MHIRRCRRLLEIEGLLDARLAAESGAVRQVTRGFGALPGALHEHHTLHRLAVRRAANRLIPRRLRQRLKPGLIDHIGAFAVAEFRQLIGVITGEAAGLNDRPDIFGAGRAAAGQIHAELPRRAAGAADLGVARHLNIRMALDLRNHLRHIVFLRCVIRLRARGESMPFGCGAAQLRLRFHQQHRIPRTRRRQRRAQSGNAATDHQNPPLATGLRIGRGQGHELAFAAGHAHVVGGHVLSEFALRLRHRPDHPLAQIGAPDMHAGEAEFVRIRPLGAGAEHHMGQALLFNIGADFRHPRLTAQGRMLLGAGDVLLGRDFGQRGQIQPPGQPAALAEIRRAVSGIAHFEAPANTCTARNAAAVALCTARLTSNGPRAQPAPCRPGLPA